MADDREERVNRIIARYLEAERDGRAPDPDKLLRKYPELATELRSFFADRQQFQKIAAPIQAPRSADSADTPTLPPSWTTRGLVGFSRRVVLKFSPMISKTFSFMNPLQEKCRPPRA